MISLKQFIADTDEHPGALARATMLGLEFAAVVLPSGMLAEDRVDRMNALWDVLASARRWSSRCSCAGYKDQLVCSCISTGRSTPIPARQKWAKLRHGA